VVAANASKADGGREDAMRGLSRGIGGALAAGLLAAAVLPGQAQGGRVSLFNGRDLTGWYTFVPEFGKNKDPLGIFKVRDGVIHVSGEKFGYISTEKEYENFRFSVDFRWGQKKWPPRENAVRDAGLLYHVQGADMVWANCLELQIQEGDTGDLWLIPGAGNAPSVEVLGATLGGNKNYTRGVKWRELERPHGEWNTVTVVARGDRFEHWVNGKVNLVGRKASQTRGRIQLQSEGAEVQYRNAVIEMLAP
jgi:hypothetical protein